MARKYLGVELPDDFEEKGSSSSQAKSEYVTANELMGLSYAEVAMTSTDILAMGTSPFELLEAPGAGKYYDVESVVLEFTAGSVQYDFGDYLALQLFNRKMITSEVITAPPGKLTLSIVKDIDNASITEYLPITINQNQEANTPLLLGTHDESDPINGDGTMLVKIWYSIRTFGTEL